jgi:hypothetical protein
MLARSSPSPVRSIGSSHPVPNEYLQAVNKALGFLFDDQMFHRLRGGYYCNGA